MGGGHKIYTETENITGQYNYTLYRFYWNPSPQQRPAGPWLEQDVLTQFLNLTETCARNCLQVCDTVTV